MVPEQDLADFAVRLAQDGGATYAEARIEQHSPEFFILKNGVLDALAVSEDAGIGVRVLVNGNLGFATTNTLTRDEVRATVEDAVRVARGSRRKDPIAFAPEKAVQAHWGVTERRKLADVDVETKLQDVLAVEKALQDTGIPLPARMFQASINRIEKYFVNSEGSRITSYSPRVRLFYFLTCMEGGDAEQTYRNYGWSGGWEALDEWKAVERIVAEARSLERSLKEGGKSPEGTFDLVCGPQVSGIASHESCGHPTEADRILGREASQAGKSFITADAIGQTVGSPEVNVCDDPTVPNAIAYYEYDDEGVKARRRYLYKDGKIHEFLQNRETAAKLGTRSNGASRAVNYSLEAIPRMANTFVEPKDWSLEELLEGVKHGIYMKSFMEWNIDDKRYNQKYVGREAYLIENGQVTSPVRKVVLEMTTPAFWSAVDAVGKDLEFEAGFCGKSDPMQALDASMGGPHMRLREVRLR
jgi:TldD protein